MVALIKSVSKRFIACLLLMMIIAAGIAVPSYAYETQASKLFSLLTAKGGSLQGYIDNVLSAEAGTSSGDWMFIALMRHDASLKGDKFIAKLDAFTATDETSNNTQKERIALAYAAAGIRNDYVDSVLELDFGATGINGVIYGLILLDSVKYDSNNNDRDAIIDDILSRRLSDNGWALFGAASDVDITSMALQALAPHKGRGDVASAIDKALETLSKKQTTDGDFKSMMGGPPTATCESTAQVIMALTSLGIDPLSDSRFIKEGNSLYDGLRRYQLSDGSYSHTIGGAGNGIATYQAACALVSAERFASGKASFYSFNVSGGGSTEPPVVTPPLQSESSGDVQEPESSSEDASSSVSSEDSSSSGESSSEEASDGSEHSSEPPSDEHSSSPASETVSSYEEAAASSGGISYKYYAAGGVVLLFVGAVVFLLIKKKATLKNILPIAFVALVLLGGVIFLNFTSVKDYYDVNIDSGSDGADTVTISINCRVLEGVAEDYPEDGYILKPTKYAIHEGDTVFDVLLAVTRAKRIKLSYTGSGGIISVYVSSINGFAEMQYGALSGWIYRVNKYTPDVGCGSYDVKDGDVIEWLYTLDLGKDVEVYD